MLCCFFSQSWAAEFSISPTKIQLRPGDVAGSVTLTNNAEDTVTVQVETFAWTRTESIADLEPTRDVIAVPPFFDIGPNEEQIIRVGLRRPVEGEKEVAYRLVLSEVPADDPAGGLGIKFALRISLPVFITPPGAKPDPVWRAHETGEAITIDVANDGQAHLRILSLKIEDRARRRVFGETSQPVYLLAGQRRSLTIPTEEALPESVVIAAETSSGPMEVVSNLKP